MVEEIRAVVVDTYALMADLTGQSTLKAIELLDSIRIGKTKGIIHYLIIYELSYHWRKGRLPFRDEEELMEFVNTYFSIYRLDLALMIDSSKIKIIGDNYLRNSRRRDLRNRRLSVSDSLTIAIAKRLNIPIITGDKDLSYVARKMGIKVIW